MEDKSASLQAAAAAAAALRPFRLAAYLSSSLLGSVLFAGGLSLGAGADGRADSIRATGRYVKNADVNVKLVSSIKQLSSSGDAVVDPAFYIHAAAPSALTDIVLH